MLLPLRPFTLSQPFELHTASMEHLHEQGNPELLGSIAQADSESPELEALPSGSVPLVHSLLPGSADRAVVHVDLFAAKSAARNALCGILSRPGNGVSGNTSTSNSACGTPSTFVRGSRALTNCSSTSSNDSITATANVPSRKAHSPHTTNTPLPYGTIPTQFTSHTNPYQGPVTLPPAPTSPQWAVQAQHEATRNSAHSTHSWQAPSRGGTPPLSPQMDDPSSSHRAAPPPPPHPGARRLISDLTNMPYVPPPPPPPPSRSNVHSTSGQGFPAYSTLPSPGSAYNHSMQHSPSGANSQWGQHASPLASPRGTFIPPPPPPPPRVGGFRSSRNLNAHAHGASTQPLQPYHTTAASSRNSTATGLSSSRTDMFTTEEFSSADAMSAAEAAWKLGEDAPQLNAGMGTIAERRRFAQEMRQHAQHAQHAAQEGSPAVLPGGDMAQEQSSLPGPLPRRSSAGGQPPPAPRTSNSGQANGAPRVARVSGSGQPTIHPGSQAGGIPRASRVSSSGQSGGGPVARTSNSGQAGPSPGMARTSSGGEPQVRATNLFARAMHAVKASQAAPPPLQSQQGAPLSPPRAPQLLAMPTSTHGSDSGDSVTALLTPTATPTPTSTPTPTGWALPPPKPTQHSGFPAGLDSASVDAKQSRSGSPQPLPSLPGYQEACAQRLAVAGAAGDPASLSRMQADLQLQLAVLGCLLCAAHHAAPPGELGRDLMGAAAALGRHQRAMEATGERPSQDTVLGLQLLAAAACQLFDLTTLENAHGLAQSATLLLRCLEKWLAYAGAGVCPDLILTLQDLHNFKQLSSSMLAQSVLSFPGPAPPPAITMRQARQQSTTNSRLNSPAPQNQQQHTPPARPQATFVHQGPPAVPAGMAQPMQPMQGAQPPMQPMQDGQPPMQPRFEAGDLAAMLQQLQLQAAVQQALQQAQMQPMRHMGSQSGQDLQQQHDQGDVSMDLLTSWGLALQQHQEQGLLSPSAAHQLPANFSPTNQQLQFQLQQAAARQGMAPPMEVDLSASLQSLAAAGQGQGWGAGVAQPGQASDHLLQQDNWGNALKHQGQGFGHGQQFTTEQLHQLQQQHEDQLASWGLSLGANQSLADSHRRFSAGQLALSPGHIHLSQGQMSAGQLLLDSMALASGAPSPSNQYMLPTEASLTLHTEASLGPSWLPAGLLAGESTDLAGLVAESQFTSHGSTASYHNPALDYASMHAEAGYSMCSLTLEPTRGPGSGGGPHQPSTGSGDSGSGMGASLGLGNFEVPPPTLALRVRGTLCRPRCTLRIPLRMGPQRTPRSSAGTRTCSPMRALRSCTPSRSSIG